MTRPKVIAGHRLGELLGRGSSARVYAAGPGLAIKLLDPHADLDRFHREAELLSSLRHPGIIAVHAHGVEQGWPYLVMERAAGEPLSIPPGGLELERCRELLRLACEALHHAHQRGIVHRDVKPANLLVSPQGLKILDFGLARGEDSLALSTTGTSLGTPAYMAPEQVAGGSRAADAKSDQYSLGVVLFQMLTGRRPFEHPEIMRLAMLHLTEAPPDPAGLRPGLPSDLRSTVLRMLAKNPLERFPDLASLQ